MSFQEIQNQEIEPVTGQVPITGFFMGMLSSSDRGYGAVRAVILIIFTFCKLCFSFPAHFDSEFRIAVSSDGIFCQVFMLADRFHSGERFLKSGKCGLF